MNTDRTIDTTKENEIESKINVGKRENSVNIVELKPISKKARKIKKNKCFSCQKKLSLVDQTIGKCKCGDVFCRTHALPSKHICSFDHLKENQGILAERMVTIKASQIEPI
jgi:hypothetical protein